MRRLIAILAFLPLTALAQLQQNQQDPALYPYKKNPPPAMMYEQGNAGIPTSGTQQANQLPNNRNRNAGGIGTGAGGPTIIQQGKHRGSPTYIIGPDGTRVCTDASGRTIVCW
ncbi:MAG TPA: hypothetical protein PLW86_06275 [Rhodocyclaceae bacterium]|nr:hypothetical protein [Rhodocyclaceae bacterium]